MSATSEEGDGVTMLDVLEAQENLSSQAIAVLGASSDVTCSYSQGYVKRQALYACVTCARDPGMLGGVCLACSYTCHDGHELIELYTKRNFRCDCGNDRFKLESKCSLCPVKNTTNLRNVYDQSFSGTYCTCHQALNDPEKQEDDVFQCVVCEDWFHRRHLGTEVPEQNLYSDMACAACARRLPYLLHVVTGPVCGDSESSDSVSSGSESSGSESSDGNKYDIARVYCHTTDQDTSTPPFVTGAIYLTNGWRTRLCRCESCMLSYEQQDVGFLVDPEDSLEAYEARAVDTGDEQVLATTAFNKLDRERQYGFVEGYCEMRDELKKYLSKFAENGKVVREEDVQEFFEGLKQRKRQRLE